MFNLIERPFLQIPGDNSSGFGSVFTNLTITVSGASAGNGTWTQASYTGMSFILTSSLDTTLEWVGQAQGVGQWGSTSNAGGSSFVLSSSIAGTPVSSGNFTLVPAGSSDVMTLASFVRCEAGACCRGATCVVSLRAACTGAAAFLGPGVACDPLGRGGSTNPCCTADINNSGAASVQDIFDFLAAYFAGCS